MLLLAGSINATLATYSLALYIFSNVKYSSLFLILKYDLSSPTISSKYLEQWFGINMSAILI